MKKFCILKPIVWNDNGYAAPCGAKSTGKNFVSKYGYGHEEWNNHPSMPYGGRAYFHSEATDKLVKEATGNLCILLITFHKGNSYIVGVGAQVSANTREDMLSIAKILKMKDRWRNVWGVNNVQQKFRGDKKAFLKHWEQSFAWIRWSCPEEYYHWFDKPIPIITSKVTYKQRVACRYNTHQVISPAIAFDLLCEELKPDHRIMAWLRKGDFTEGKISPSRAQNRKYGNTTKDSGRKGRNRPTDMIYSYWIEGNRTVNPKHAPYNGPGI